MATPPVAAQTNNVGGANTEHSANVDLNDIEQVSTRKFKRTYVHYFANGADARGYTQETLAPGNNLLTGFMWDNGEYIIPYWNPAISMTPQDFVELGSVAQAVRIDTLGYSIKQCDIYKQEKVAVSGTTTITSTMVQYPYIHFRSDDLHQFDDCVMPRPVTNVVPDQSIGYSELLYPNNGYQFYEKPQSNGEAQLKRCVIAWKNNAGIGFAPDLPLQQQDQQNDPWACMDGFNHQHVKLMDREAFSKHSYTWHSKDKGEWYPIRMPLLS